jgi:hypothetical protein
VLLLLLLVVVLTLAAAAVAAPGQQQRAKALHTCCSSSSSGSMLGRAKQQAGMRQLYRQQVQVAAWGAHFSRACCRMPLQRSQLQGHHSRQLAWAVVVAAHPTGQLLRCCCPRLVAQYSTCCQQQLALMMMMGSSEPRNSMLRSSIRQEADLGGIVPPQQQRQHTKHAHHQWDQGLCRSSAPHGSQMPHAQQQHLQLFRS